MKIQVPYQVRSDADGFTFFAELLAKTKDIEFQKILLDFARTSWFEANLCSILGACVASIEDQFNNVELVGLNHSINDIFSRNQFLSYYGGEATLDLKETTIRFKSYRRNDDKLFRQYLDNELLIKPELPQMSKFLSRKMGESIFELFSNAVTHGNCKRIYTCGQFYPRKSPPRIDFTVVDLGRTIKRNVSEYLGTKISGKNAIEWAFTEGHTTKQGAVPGGLGLKLIKEFLDLNKGKIQVMSANGYWAQVKSKVVMLDTRFSFPGTIVNLEFNVADTSEYYLQEEIDMDNLF